MKHMCMYVCSQLFVFLICVIEQEIHIMRVQSVCVMSENDAESFDNGRTCECSVSAGDKPYIDHFRSFVYGGSPMQCFM